MNKNIAFFLSAFLVGFFIGRITVEAPPLAEPARTDLESEYYNIEQKAKNDLANARTTEQKLKEIQKLREEIFQIFLADIALKIDKKFWSNIDLSVQPSATPELKIEARPIPIEIVAEVKKEPAAPTTQPNTQNEEHNIPYNNPLGILKDPEAFHSSSKLITSANNRLIQRIQGLFKGDALMSEPRNRVWKISINSSLNYLENNWTGNVSIEMADENNVVFSNSNGRGSNNYFYQNPDDLGSIIVQASPDTFLYLKWLEGRQTFWGSVYKKTGKEKNWKRIGRILSLAKE
ncbi:MAG: hypothetical protein WC635_12190 [Bacteriovorax sp.]|jgi:hypothetical protein